MSTCRHDAVTRWHLEDGLLLNPNKTEAIVTGTQQHVAKLKKHCGFKVAEVTVPLSKTLWVLGVAINEHLSFGTHVGNIVKVANYHVLRHIHQFITQDMANTIACSMISMRIDYCNTILSNQNMYFFACNAPRMP